MSSIQLSFAVSTAVILLLVIVTGVIAYFFYRFTLPPVPRGKRILLTLLRAVGLSLVILFLFEPLLRFIFSSVQRPALALLIDNSKSMAIVDRSVDRAEQLSRILTHPVFDRVAKTGDLRFYTFGNTVRPAGKLTRDSLSLAEDGSDINGAIRMLNDEKNIHNIGAALLITDGSYNLGQNPIHTAELLGMPVFTLGIGDSTEQKDLLITKLVTNDLVYNETEVPVDLTVKSSGYGGERVGITLNEGDVERSKATLTLEEGTREYAVRLQYTPEGEGVKKYTVHVTSLPGELTAANNRRSFLAKVLKSKQRVLIVAGAPSPDLSVIRQTLSEDENLTVQTLTQRLPSGFYEGTLTTGTIDSTDCLVLIGFPTDATNSSVLEMLRRAITQNAKPFLFATGKTVDERKLNALGPILPFTQSNTSHLEQLVFVEPSTAHGLHPILNVGSEDGIASWKRLPPIFKAHTTYRARPEATVLGFTKVQNVVLTEPLILIRNVNRHKAVAVLGYGLWRWRLMAQGTSDTRTLLSAFLTNSIRWATTREEDRPVKVTTTKEAFTEGEAVEFLGQVYDESARPVDDAQVRVTALQNGKEFETLLRPLGNGRYEGSIEGLGEGDYSYRALALGGGRAIGNDKGRFSVGELNLEFLDTRMNVSLLRQLAMRTGGSFLPPTSLDELPDILTSLESFSQRTTSRAMDFELWNWQYSLGLVVLLFSMEWFIRKRNGML